MLPTDILSVISGFTVFYILLTYFDVWNSELKNLKEVEREDDIYGE